MVYYPAKANNNKKRHYFLAMQNKYLTLFLATILTFPVVAMEPDVVVPLNQPSQSNIHQNPDHAASRRYSKACVRFSSMVAIVSSGSSAAATILDIQRGKAKSYATDGNDVKDFTDFLSKASGIAALKFAKKANEIDDEEEREGLIAATLGLVATTFSALANHGANHADDCNDRGKACYVFNGIKNLSSTFGLVVAAKGLFFSRTALKRPHSDQMKIDAAKRALAIWAWGFTALSTTASWAADIKGSTTAMLVRDGAGVASGIVEMATTSDRVANKLLYLDNRPFGLGLYEVPGDKFFASLPEGELSDWLRLEIRDRALATGRVKVEYLTQPNGPAVIGLELKNSDTTLDKVILLVGRYDSNGKVFSPKSRWLTILGQRYDLPTDLIGQVEPIGADQITIKTNHLCEKLLENLAIESEIVYDLSVKQRALFHHGQNSSVIEGERRFHFDVAILFVRN